MIGDRLWRVRRARIEGDAPPNLGNFREYMEIGR